MVILCIGALNEKEICSLVGVFIFVVVSIVFIVMFAIGFIPSSSAKNFPETHPQAYSMVEDCELSKRQWEHIIEYPQIVCLECGKVNWQENGLHLPAYCIDCGSKLYDETKCPNCGADISGGYCSQCGFDLLEFWGSEVGE